MFDLTEAIKVINETRDRCLLLVSEINIIANSLESLKSDGVCDEELLKEIRNLASDKYLIKMDGAFRVYADMPASEFKKFYFDEQHREITSMEFELRDIFIANIASYNLFVNGIKPTLLQTSDDYFFKELKETYPSELVPSLKGNYLFARDVNTLDVLTELARVGEDKDKKHDLLGRALGFPPKATEEFHSYEGERIGISYHGIMFTVKPQLVLECLDWLNETYTIPENLAIGIYVTENCYIPDFAKRPVHMQSELRCHWIPIELSVFRSQYQSKALSKELEVNSSNA